MGGDKQAKGSKRSVLEKRTHMFVNGAIHQVEHKGDDRLQAINNHICVFFFVSVGEHH